MSKGKKKKLVHLISSLKQGGAESLLVDLLAELKNYEHAVIYFHDGPNRERLKQLGITTYQVKGLFCLYDPLFLVRLGYMLWTLKPDCVHTSLWAANFVGRLLTTLLRIPIISVIHLGVNQDGKVRNLLDATTFWLSGDVVAVSKEIASGLEKKGLLPAQRISLITNGISYKRIQSYAQKKIITRSDLEFDERTFIIGSVGRFIPRKNFSLLIAAFAQCVRQKVEARLVLVGFGPLEKALRKQVEDLNITDKVRFIVGESAYSYYPLFDCFVLPSLQEGMSIALLEALCFSVPCIVAHANKMHEVITSGMNGFVMPINNQEELVKKMTFLIDHKETAHKMGKNAFELVKTRYTMESMARDYAHLFDKNIERAQRRENRKYIS
jgi:glycosyltransferase involved in cell wall biosynthesis